jgi:hypothetical protein
MLRTVLYGLRVVGLSVLSVLFGATSASANELFTKVSFKVPLTFVQSVVPANITSNQDAELLVIGRDEQQQRHMLIYQQGQSGYKLLDRFTVAESIFGFDLGDVNTDGIQGLFFLSKSTIKQYIPALGSSQAELLDVQKVTSLYRIQEAESFTYINFAYDINDDQRDDFILPSFEQVNVWLTGCCAARHQQSLPIAAGHRKNAQGISFFKPSVYFADMNMDQKTDVVTVGKGELLVFEQVADKRFSQTSKVIEIAPDIDGKDWWQSRDANGQEKDQSKLAHRKFDNLKDVNGDGITDLIVKYTKSSSVFDKAMDYQFFYGKANAGLVTFSRQPSTQIKSDETIVDIEFVDLQEDGKLEVMVTSFDIGLSQIISALVSGGIDQQAMLFAMDEQQQFPQKPLLKEKVEMTFSLSSGKTGQPLTKMADVNGDGYKDLVYSDESESIYTQLATPNGKRDFARRPIKHKVMMPKNPSRVAFHDLNGDDRQDIVFKYLPRGGKDKQQTITILMAKGA